MSSPVNSRKFKSLNRRELLKLAPVVALGAFAIPKLQAPLLKAGLGFSDWASARMFRRSHLGRKLHTRADPGTAQVHAKHPPRVCRRLGRGGQFRWRAAF